MKKFIKALLLSAAFMSSTFPLTSSIASAAGIDAYREMLINGTYTIRYENVTPAARETNRDKRELFGSSGMAIGKNDYLINKPISGLVVGNGNLRYEEVGDERFSMCRLTRGGENFLFTKYVKGDGVEYFGKSKNRVAANNRNVLAELIDGKSYGDEDMTRLLNAMLPDGVKSSELPRYSFVKRGRAKDGLTYEDYKSTEDGSMSAVRYYFDGDRLIKIAAANYRKDSKGRIDGRQCIINIVEFSSTPDEKYLSLPEGVKDVTRRKEARS